MKKQVLSLLLAAALCLGMLPAKALAAEGEREEAPPIEDAVPPAEKTPSAEETSPVEDVDTDAVLLEETPTGGTWGNITWTLDEAGTLTVSGKSIGSNSTAMRDYPWYNHRASLKAVIIEEGVTSIGTSAFSVCSNLTRVTLPDSVTYIGKSAFYGCGKLTDLTLPSGVNFIGESAFHGCSSLEYAEIPSRVTTVNSYVFYGCIKLKNVTIPESVTSIGSEAFYNCSSLEYVEIPSRVTTIGSSAFHGCSGLTNVTIPEGAVSIGDYAFNRCYKLESMTIPVSVQNIGAGTFYNCPNLTDIYYTGSLEQWKQRITSGRFHPPKQARIHFTTGETVLTVTLDPTRNGWLDSKYQYIAAVVGEPCGELPIPTRDGYIFLGWFTAEEGGEQVTAETVILEEDVGRTLYAHWNVDWLKEMTYSFGNSFDDFGYAGGYRIPYERYACVFGDTPRAKKLYEKSAEWSGSCFGMSSTSAMFTQTDSGSSVKAFRSGAKRPYDLTVSDQNEAWDLTLREYIETMQIAQKSQRINRHWNGCSLEVLCAQAKAFQQSGEDPVVVDIWGTVENGNTGGHAMLVYGLVEISPSESRLMVYDPNFPNEERYITINRSNGAYTGWYYHLSDTFDWGTGDPNATIACIPYADFYGTWTEKPVACALPDREAALMSAEEESALLIFNTDNAKILDAEGKQIAAVENGRLKTDRTDIFPMMDVGVLPDGTAAGRENTILFLPPDQYTIEREDSSEPLDAVMVHVGQSAAVTTSGSSVTFAVDDGCALNYARANGDSGSEPGTYTITLESSLLEKPEETPGIFYTVTASGSLDGKGASAAQAAGELFAENVPADDIQVNGIPVSTEDLGDGGTLDIPGILDPSVTATLQEDGSVVLGSSLSGVAHVYAAFYDSNGRMTELVTGTWEADTIRFSKPVTEDVRLFLLKDNYAPAAGRVVVKRQA